jgi:hypothetical protein
VASAANSTNSTRSYHLLGDPPVTGGGQGAGSRPIERGYIPLERASAPPPLGVLLHRDRAHRAANAAGAEDRELGRCRPGPQPDDARFIVRTAEQCDRSRIEPARLVWTATSRPRRGSCTRCGTRPLHVGAPRRAREPLVRGAAPPQPPAPPPLPPGSPPSAASAESAHPLPVADTSALERASTTARCPGPARTSAPCARRASGSTLDFVAGGHDWFVSRVLLRDVLTRVAFRPASP